MGREKILSRRFTDIAVMNYVQVYDHKFRVIGYERVVIHSSFSYWWAVLSFYKVEYMSCPLYLEHNFRWRLALPDEAEHVVERYRMSAGDRKRTQGESNVYCIEESLAGYHPPLQRAPYTFYIVAQGVEIKVSYWGEDFDKLGISHFQ